MATTVSRDYIVSALKSGFDDSQIAAALGVTQSAVAQLIDAHNLRDLAARNSRFTSIDEKLNNIEESALTGLEKQVKYMTDPMKLLKVVTGINSAKRRSLAEGGTITNNNNVQLVQVQLPAHLKVDIKLNAQNQVVAVDDRELTTMQSGKLLKTMEHRGQAQLTDGHNSQPKTAAEISRETTKEGKCVADYL